MITDILMKKGGVTHSDDLQKSHVTYLFAKWAIKTLVMGGSIMIICELSELCALLPSVAPLLLLVQKAPRVDMMSFRDNKQVQSLETLVQTMTHSLCTGLNRQ